MDSPTFDGARPRLSCEKRRVLIVDDEKAIRDVFLTLVSSGLPDCRIDVAVNGAEAVEAFRSAHQGVIIMDLHMPVMDGETAFHRICQVCEQDGVEMPSILFCTGYDPGQTVRDLVENDPRHGLLLKPVKIAALLGELEKRLPPAAA